MQIHPATASGWLLALALASAPAHAVNQCQDAQGRKVFSDLPCAHHRLSAPAAQTPDNPSPTAQPIVLPVLTAGQGSPRELVTALFRCLEAASMASQKQFLRCSLPGESAHRQASQDWPALLDAWRQGLPRRLLAIDGEMDATERFGSIRLVGGEMDQMDLRLSARFTRHEGRWKLVQLQLPTSSP